MASGETTAVDARRQSNLAFSFFWLKPEERAAMSVFYDFCRRVDDIADDTAAPTETKAAALNAWRADLDAIAAGNEPAQPLAKELAPVVKRFGVAVKNLHDIVDGVAHDLEPRGYANFEELRQYCYGVASAVGLVSIRIFGCKNSCCPEFAESLGYALQLTNILRDVVEDKKIYGRVYLPRDEMAAFGVTPEMLNEPNAHPACAKLFRLQYFRAKHYFHKARRLLPAEERKNLGAALIMGVFYEDILDKIAHGGFQLSEQRIRISKLRKLQLVTRVWRGLKKPLPQLAPPGRVAVFGAGVAGLSAALMLAEQGFAVDVYEAKNFPGGRASSLRDAPSGLTLDNGQHIVMGCYHAFLRLLGRIGARDRLAESAGLSVDYVAPEGNWSRLAAARLPAPFHLLAGLFNFSALNFADRIAILRMGLSLKYDPPPANSETAAQWLKLHWQTPGAVRALWEPFCLAALNEPLATASAVLLRETLRRSLFGAKSDSAIFFARVGLSDLFRPEAELYLRATGGSLHFGTQIAQLNLADGMVNAETAKGEAVAADHFISALPWAALRSLLPETSSLRAQLEKISPAGILNIHLLSDRKLFAAPFAGLLDSPFHWVFDRSDHLPPERQGREFLYAVTMSAADEAWLARKSDDILSAVRAELARYFPAAKDAKFLRELVIKTKDATFAARPDAEPARPGPRTPWKNFYLAGDWTATQLPATLEGAALSGEAAARAIDKQQIR
ncbi:MAG TPA: hydroxysqualene dehydroxylase HpnE [Opitutales bacterium]|jgi:squalene synthase HpnD|nr:hydroxysqualene dehydroxylase HpnE [Opitutales bacterium]